MSNFSVVDAGGDEWTFVPPHYERVGHASVWVPGVWETEFGDVLPDVEAIRERVGLMEG